MKRKAASMLLTAAFLAIVFCPHILWRFLSAEMGGESEEKRTLAEKPVLSLAEIEAYPRAYEAYYDDHLPFRDLLIKLYNSMQVHVFHTSSSDDVILGKDGWLFYRSVIDGTALQCYDGSLLFTREELEEVAANLTEMRDRLAERGTEFVVYVAPIKGRIYGEYMPDHIGQPAQLCMYNQIMDYLRSHTDIRVVSPLEEMLAYKKMHPQELLFYQTDTHWNERGAYLGAQALLRELGIQTPSLDRLKTVSVPAGRYDLESLLNVWDMDDDGAAAIVFDELLPEVQELAYEFNGKMEYKVPGAEPIRFFMHKDSFGSGMAPYLKHHFSHSLMLHNVDYDAERMWAFEPDVFVLEVNERYIRRLRNPLL